MLFRSADARARCVDAIDTHEFYARLATAGLGFGPTFRGLHELHVGATEAVGRISLARGVTLPTESWLLHPAQLDACFHVIGARLAAEQLVGDADVVYLPIGIDALTLAQAAPAEMNCVATLRASVAGQESLRVADLRLETVSGDLIATISGLRDRKSTRLNSSHG